MSQQNTAAAADNNMPSESLQLNELDYVTKIVLLEAKRENRLTNQLLITKLSAYSKNPINLLINAPSGVGKNYVINKVAAVFPKSDISVLSGMTEKALFHRKGELVVWNEETEQHESIEEKLSALNDAIFDKESELSLEKDKEVKQDLKSKIKELEKARRDLLKNSKKLIDLENKILVFLDTPPERLIIQMLPLLSHDEYEIQYEYTDTHNGITTQTNVLRGWPVVIIAQALDYSDSPRYNEIQRRFITTNPAMSLDKFNDAVNHICDMGSVPDEIYQADVVSDKEKDIARDIIQGLKEQILHINENIKPGKKNVITPFKELLKSSLPKVKAEDMTRANRINAYLGILPSIYFSNRPRLEVYKDGEEDNVLSKSIRPIATFEDLQRTVWLTEYSDGVRPFVLEWFYDVFQKTYQSKCDVTDSKVNSRGEELKEVRVAVTSADLIKRHKQVHGETIIGKKLSKSYIDPLHNNGYIDKLESQIDKRNNIYYPIIETKEYRKLFSFDKGNNFSQEMKKIVVNSAIFPNQVFIVNQFNRILNRYSEIGYFVKIKNHADEEITVDQLVNQYYSNPENYFEERNEDDIIKEEQTTADAAETAAADEKKQESEPKEEGEDVEGQYMCNFCTKAFSTDDTHTEHVIKVHRKDDPLIPIRPTKDFILEAQKFEPGLHVEFRGNYWEKEGSVETLD